MTYEIDRIRKDFPILHRPVYDKNLAFLDNAASTQKPRAVIDAVKQCYEAEYANIHRGLYYLSMKATEAFDKARRKAQHFINASSEKEIIFVRGATEGINLVASSYGRNFLQADDEIILSEMEHHSNIVPWQMLRDEKGIILKIVPINDVGEIIMEEYKNLLSDKTKLVAITHISNALGSIIPIKEIITLAHESGAKVLVDGCQAVPHMNVDMQALDCDFYVFSGHKMYAPTGIGILYGKEDLLDAMPPYHGGGEMIRSVTFEKTTYNELPYKFEAGTPAIAQVIGLGAAIDYLEDIGMDAIFHHEKSLFSYAIEKMQQMEGIHLIGTAKEKAGIISFTMEGIHPHDIGTLLDHEGVAIRTGHHCAQPVMQHYGVSATARASFGMYNTRGDVDALIHALLKTQEFFA